jgi:hypothetical protein
MQLWICPLYWRFTLIFAFSSWRARIWFWRISEGLDPKWKVVALRFYLLDHVTPWPWLVVAPAFFPNTQLGSPNWERGPKLSPGCFLPTPFLKVSISLFGWVKWVGRIVGKIEGLELAMMAFKPSPSYFCIVRYIHNIMSQPCQN